MQLLRLEVRNWVHHRHRVCEFSRGLVAILGENGSGKSSLFGALKWLLTGENPNYGVKTDNISQYAKDGEPAYATLEFEHAGHIACVTRHLRPATEQSTFTVDGVETGRGDKSVTVAIEKLLGVDAKFISRFIIVGQTEIFSFIDDNQTDTDKFFQRLFNTQRADKCQDVLGKQVAKISIPEIVRTPAVVEVEREAAASQVTALQKQLAGLPSLDEFFATQKADQAVVESWNAREKAAAELAKLEAGLVSLAASYKLVEEECQRYADDLDALDEASRGQEDSIAAARTALGHWQSYKNVAQSKERLHTGLAAIDAARAKDPAPEKPGTPSSDELASNLVTVRRKIKEINAFVDMFDAQGVAACPTCHTPSANLADRVAEQKKTLVTLQAELTEQTAAYTNQFALEATWQQWEKRENARETEWQKLAAAEQGLQNVTPPALSEAELAQTVADYESFQAARKDIAPLAEKARLRKAALDGQLATSHERQKQLTDEIANATATAADVQFASKRLGWLRDAMAERAKVDQALTVANCGLENLEKEHAQAVAEERRAQRLRQWTAVAERTRDALKSAPRLVAQRNLQRLEASINELLRVFAVNFLVRVAEDGTPTFIAEFYDGRKQVAQRLSIGQKTVLALAFRVAVNAMFAEEIGLLALDEPTASLDQPRIQALAPVLDKLRELSTAKGLQCLLVTHAASLSNLFESAIELEPPELRHVNTDG